MTKQANLRPDQTPLLIDPYNRRLNYLRVSITDRCNLRCVYCAPHDLIPKLSHDDILSYEEILRVVRLGIGLGISKVRITGGEPLVRKGVYDFLAQLNHLPGIEDISLTTNGLVLKDHIHRIVAAGVKRLNISLDSLQPERYREITGHDAFEHVWAGIEAAEARGIFPIKLNVVGLKGYNDGELIDFARLTYEKPYHIRFIEFMPIGVTHYKKADHLRTPDIKKRIQTLGTLTPVAKDAHDGPAQRYKLAGARGEIGFISAMSHHFCHTCNRLRLTASGQLRSCLLSTHQFDLKEVLRKGGVTEETDQALIRVFLKAIRKKPMNHRITDDSSNPVEGHMSSIGG